MRGAEHELAGGGIQPGGERADRRDDRSDGRTWSYSYTGLRLTGLRQPTSTSDDVTIGYDPGTGRVSSYATMAGTWQYASSDAGDTRTTVVTDPQGHRTTYMFQISNQRPTGVTDALGHTWSYGYDALGRLQTATAPEGNHSDYSYDASGNVTRTVTTAKNGVDTIATSAVYGNACPGVACASPTATTDARGATTDYGYDGYGHVTSVTLPAPAAGAARPQTRYGYDTRVASYRQSAGAGPTPSAYAISLPARVSACRTGASCDGTGDETRTTIAYDAALNLTPSSSTSGAGDGSLVATTGYGYDLYGNATVVDGPLTGVDDRLVSVYDAARALQGAIRPRSGRGRVRSSTGRRGTRATGTAG